MPVLHYIQCPDALDTTGIELEDKAAPALEVGMWEALEILETILESEPCTQDTGVTFL